MNRFRLRLMGPVYSVALLISMAACQLDDKEWQADAASQPSLPEQVRLLEWLVDASDFDQYMGINLLTGEQFRQLEHSDWHLAFRRYQEVGLSGGLLGGKFPVRAAIASPQLHFYDAQNQQLDGHFLNAQAASYAHLLDPSQYQLDALQLKGEQSKQLIGQQDQWSLAVEGQAGYRTGLDRAWVISSGQGRDLYALWFAEQAVKPLSDGALELSFMVQQSSREQSAVRFNSKPQRVSIQIQPGQEQGFNLVSASWVGDANNWHVKVKLSEQSELSLALNGGSSGPGRVKAQGPYSQQELAELDASGMYSMGFLADGLDNAFTQWPRFAYLQQHGHQMLPNYRTYYLDLANEQQFLLQITDYYHPITGASGHLSLRVAVLPSL